MKQHDVLAAEISEKLGGRISGTLQEIADVVGPSVSTLRRECQRGRLRAFRSNDSSNSPLRIRTKEIARWIIESEGGVFPPI